MYHFRQNWFEDEIETKEGYYSVFDTIAEIRKSPEGEASVISLLEQKDPNMEHSVIIGINKQLSNIKKM